jgi:hypothetical protein
MGRRAGDGFGQEERSSACASGAHRDCGHCRMGMRRRASRDRLESTVVLCGCDCHAACALAGRAPVSLTVWQQLCVCPGADWCRTWKEDWDDPFPGSRQARERDERAARGRAEARRQAFEAARAAAQGKTRGQVRDIYLAELRARGQEPSPGWIFEAEVDFLTGHPLRALWKLRASNPYDL